MMQPSRSHRTRQWGRSGLKALLIGALGALLAGCLQAAGPATAPTLTPALLTPAAPPAPTVSVRVSPTTPARTTAPAATAATARPMPPTATHAPESLMALGTRLTLTVRSRPAAQAAATAQLDGAQTLWIEGRSRDGQWLWVRFGEPPQRGWLAAGHVQPFGDIATLPIVADDGALLATAQPPRAATAALAIVTRAPLPPRPAATRPPATGKIVFETASGGDIYLSTADGSGLRRLTAGLDPMLSPDGGRVAFTRWDVPNGVYVLDLATGVERRIAEAQKPRWPTWRPDGAALVFSHVTGTEICYITAFDCVPEGALRAFFRGQECIDTAQGRICISDYPVQTIDLTHLAQIDLGDGSWYDVPTDPTTQAPSWQGAGQMLLFQGRTGLQLTPLTGPARSLIEDPTVQSASWSPDGQWIIAQARRHDHWDIVLLDAAGQLRAQLTTPDLLAERAADNVAPAWSADGRTILFLSNREGDWRAYRMNADGSGQSRFLPQALAGIAFRYDYANERIFHWGR